MGYLGLAQPGLCLLATRTPNIGRGETQEAWVPRS